jgi:hypothetical protein
LGYRVSASDIDLLGEKKRVLPDALLDVPECENRLKPLSRGADIAAWPRHLGPISAALRQQTSRGRAIKRLGHLHDIANSVRSAGWSGA